MDGPPGSARRPWAGPPAGRRRAGWPGSGALGNGRVSPHAIHPVDPARSRSRRSRGDRRRVQPISGRTPSWTAGQPAALAVGSRRPLLIEAVETALRAARLTNGDVDRPWVRQSVSLATYSDLGAVAQSGRPLVRVAAVRGGTSQAGSASQVVAVRSRRREPGPGRNGEGWRPTGGQSGSLRPQGAE